MLTIKDLMIKYQISRKTVYNWIDKGLPCKKIGGLVRFDQDQVNKWIDEYSQKGDKGVI